jgi:hypothetical protein
MSQDKAERRTALEGTLKHIVALPYCDEDLAAYAQAWMDGDAEAGKKLYDFCVLNGQRDFTGTPFEKAWTDNGKMCPCECCAGAREVVANADLFA